MKEWEMNTLFFKRLKDTIKSAYGKETYVVIYKQKIIDSGDDKLQLAKLHKDKKPALITCVKDYDKLKEIPSPEIIQK